MPEETFMKLALELKVDFGSVGFQSKQIRSIGFGVRPEQWIFMSFSYSWITKSKFSWVFYIHMQNSIHMQKLLDSKPLNTLAPP